MNTKPNSHFILTRLDTIHQFGHSVPLSAQGRALPEFIALATWLVLGLLYAYLAEEGPIRIAHAFESIDLPLVAVKIQLVCAARSLEVGIGE